MLLKLFIVLYQTYEKVRASKRSLMPPELIKFEVANRRNSWFIAKDPSYVPPKYPASVMVFGVVASDGKVMLPHFIDVGLKINYSRIFKRF